MEIILPSLIFASGAKSHHLISIADVNTLAYYKKVNINQISFTTFAPTEKCLIVL
jgi:hypothetical protein